MYKGAQQKQDFINRVGNFADRVLASGADPNAPKALVSDDLDVPTLEASFVELKDRIAHLTTRSGENKVRLLRAKAHLIERNPNTTAADYEALELERSEIARQRALIDIAVGQIRRRLRVLDGMSPTITKAEAYMRAAQDFLPDELNKLLHIKANRIVDETAQRYSESGEP